MTVKQLSILMILLLGWGGVWGQVTIVADGLNNSSNLFTPSGGAYYSGNSASGDRPASSPFAIEGSHSYGISNGTASLTSLSDISTIGFSNVALSFRLASFSINSSGNGADNGDIVIVEVSPDGGSTYFSTITVAGNSNAYWAYSSGTGNASTPYDGDANPVGFAPAGGGNRTADGYSTVTITSLPSISNLRIRITALNNHVNERWVIDDFKITGTSNLPPNITHTGTSPASVDVLQGSADNILYQIAVAVTNDQATLTQVVASASGSWDSDDLDNFKLRYSTNATLDGGDATLATVDMGLSGGSQEITFSGFSQVIPIGTAYLFVTCDVDAMATLGNTVACGPDADGDFTYTENETNSGSTFATANAITFVNVPEIQLEHPVGSDISCGATVNLGSIEVNTSGTTTVRISNEGLADLSLDNLPLTIAGADAGQFSITTQPLSPISASGSSDIIISFNPTSVGVKNASISIENNDSDEDPCVINLTGTGICAPPSSQATNLGTANIGQTQMDVSWTRGTGDNVLVVAREGGAVNTDPTNGISYTANAAFSSGDEIGTGNYVVYNGTGTSVTVTGLTLGTTYHYAIYEYNNTDVCYLTPALTGNATTDAPSAGDLIITEIMQDPAAVSDGNGEWFEIYNTTGSAINIQGWVIKDNGSDSHTIGSFISVPAGGYVVLGNNDNNSTNGGVTVDYEYTGYTLANSDDEVVLYLPDGTTEIDRVNYDGGPGFPDPAGASMSLDPDHYNSTGNDDGSHWCIAFSTFGDGDKGTPGSVNDDCGPSVTTYYSTGDGNYTDMDFWNTASDGSGSSATYPTLHLDDVFMIQAGHDVTVSTGDVTANKIEIEETGSLVVSNASSNLGIKNGQGGADLIVNGTFSSHATGDIVDLSTHSASWSIGPNGMIIQTNSGNPSALRSGYEGGISTIPSTANWILRYTGAENPDIMSTSGMHYPNLIIESTTGSWDATGSSQFKGSGDYPRVKGNLDIGGLGAGTVTFYTINTNATPVTVSGNLTIRSGSTFTNNGGGTGVAVSGDVTNEGTLNFAYGSGNAGVLRFEGSVQQNFNGGGIADVRNVVVNNAAGLNLGADLAATELLTLTSGSIITNANHVSITNSASASITGFNASRYIQGNLNRAVSNGISYDFPIGNGSTYAPVTIEITTTNATSILGYYDPGNEEAILETKECEAQSQEFTYDVFCGSWEFTPNITGTEDYTMTLSNAQNCSKDNYTIAKNGSYDDCPSGFTNNYTSWSRFDLLGGPAGSPLPVELTEFNATLHGGVVNITWATASEINNDYFLVQHSTDASRFEDLGMVPGAGTSTQSQTYEWLHEYPSVGVNYYRLKQVDFDGQYEYSPIRAVQFEGDAVQGSWTLRPTVTHDQIYLIRTGRESSAADWTILTPEGRQVMRGTVPEGTEQMPLTVSSLSGGLYILRVSNREGVWSGRFQKD